MKIACAVLAVAVMGLCAGAQSGSGSIGQPVKVEMVCRDMATTGNYLGPNESIVGTKACHPVAVERLSDAAAAEAKPASQPPAIVEGPPETHKTAAGPFPYSPNPTPAAEADDAAIRVFVTDRQSWDARGGWSGNAAKSAGASDKDTNAEVEKLVTEVGRQCPRVVITSSLDKAAFAVTLNHEGKTHLTEHNKVVVFNRGADVVFSATTRGLSDSVGDACRAMVTPAKR